MGKFKVKVMFKGDKTYHIDASDENDAQDKAVEMLEYDIPDSTYLEIAKVERLDRFADDEEGN